MNENDSKLELIRLQYRLLNVLELLELDNTLGFKVFLLTEANSASSEVPLDDSMSFELSGPQFDLARKGLKAQLQGRLKELEASYLTLLRSNKENK